MKVTFALGAALVFALAGCSQGGDQPTEPPTSSTLTVVVANQAGIPLEGIHVRAQQTLSPMELVDLPPTATTDASGTASITLPINITATIGLSNVIEPADGLPREERFQNTLIVPSENVTLYYQFPVTLDCATVDPSQPSSCPEQPVPTSESPSPQITPYSSPVPEAPTEAPTDKKSNKS